MSRLEKHCVDEDCDSYPLFGFQPVKSVPAKWACAKHQHLLYRENEPAKPIARGDLFSQ